MTYLINSREVKSKQSGKRKALALIFGAFILIFLAIQWFAPHFLPALFASVARPFWRAEFSVESGSLKSPQELLAENEMLKLRLVEAEVRLNTIGSVELENGELRTMLTVSSSSLQSALVPVITRPPFAPYDELIIDGGVDRGFTVGDKVYAPGNILIGSIADALNRTSKVILFSSPDQTYQVLIGQSNAPATAVGMGGGQYSAQVSHEVKVNEGDFVVNPSLNDRPFGVVSAVLNEPAEPFQTVLFAPPVNLYQLRWLLVEKARQD